MIQEQLVSLLSPVVGKSIYPNIAPANVGIPFIVYMVVASPPESVIDGPPPIKNTRVQVDVYDHSYLSVQKLATQVEGLMDTWRVQNVRLLRQDRFDSDANLHRVILDFSIWHYE